MFGKMVNLMSSGLCFWYCLRCNSSDVTVYDEWVDRGALQSIAKCNECGLVGPVMWDFVAGGTSSAFPGDTENRESVEGKQSGG